MKDWIIHVLAGAYSFVAGISYAQDAAAPAAAPEKVSTFDMMILPLGIMLIFYFFFLRPQSKKLREQQKLMTELKVGDEVVTQSGIIGKVRSIADQFVTLELSQGASVKMLKSSILQTTEALLAAKNNAAAKVPASKDKAPQKA